jgi:transposase
MSMPEEKQNELFTSDRLLADLLPPGDPMIIFSQEIYPAFRDKQFEECYSDMGRNAISPAFLALVTILQWRESMSDEEAADACIRRLDWKIALHLPSDWRDRFHATTLCRYRKRLIENGKMTIIFDRILELCREKGFIKERSKQRIDATHIVKHINRIATTDLLFRTVRALVEEIERKEPDFYQEHISDDIKERYGKPFSSFGYSKERRADKQLELIEDGFQLRAMVHRYGIQNLDQLTIMETVFSENVVIHEKEINGKTFLEIEEISAPKQTIFDPKDTELKLGVKGKTKWVGSKCHVIETAEENQTNFITGMIRQQANENDIKILPRLEEQNAEQNLNPEKIFADGNYISGNAIKKFEEKGQKLMGYIQGDTSAKEETFRLQKFEIDSRNRTAVCPVGKRSVRSTIHPNGDASIYFGRMDCSRCDFFSSCVGSAKQGCRRLHVVADYEYVARRRREQATKAFRKEMKTRARIEGTISELVRFYGLRKIKYKGRKGRDLQVLLSAAALNVKRLLCSITASSQTCVG